MGKAVRLFLFTRSHTGIFCTLYRHWPHNNKTHFNALSRAISAAMSAAHVCAVWGVTYLIISRSSKIPVKTDPHCWRLQFARNPKTWIGWLHPVTAQTAKSTFDHADIWATCSSQLCWEKLDRLRECLRVGLYGGRRGPEAYVWQDEVASKHCA